MQESKVIITDKTVAEKISSFIETIAENLDLQSKAERLNDDDLNDIIRNFENHLSIMKIEQNINKTFFLSVTIDKVKRQIKVPDTSKSQPFNTTYTKNCWR